MQTLIDCIERRADGACVRAGLRVDGYPENDGKAWRHPGGRVRCWFLTGDTVMLVFG